MMHGYIPTNFAFATTINFWNSIVVFLLHNSLNKYYVLFSYFISFSVMIVGIKIKFLKENYNLISTITGKIFMNYIVPYILTRKIITSKNINITNIKLKTKLILLSILVIVGYNKYLNIISQNDPFYYYENYYYDLILLSFILFWKICTN